MATSAGSKVVAQVGNNAGTARQKGAGQRGVSQAGGNLVCYSVKEPGGEAPNQGNQPREEGGALNHRYEPGS